MTGSPGIQALIAVTISEEFESNGLLRIVNIAFEPGAFRLSLDVYCQPTATPQRWTVMGNGIREIRGLCATAQDLELTDDPLHPALREHTDDEVGLSFARAPSLASSVIGELVLSHRQAAKRFIPFGHYLNRMPLDELLNSGSGQLGSGPRFLMESYCQVLDRFEMRPTIVPAPRRSQVAPLQLLTFGEAFIVAENFVARLET
ncbi:MAG: hypothetical protein K8T20_06610 [Planctomycetes bacterium]|nr:hypothetical protein [Planctomycetota bacterium]